MELTGQVWFRFGSPGVWLFYRFARHVAEAGIPVSLEWVPLPHGDERLAMGAFMSLDDANSRGRFLHALLGLIHMEGRSVMDDQAVIDAMSAAEVDVDLASIDASLLEAVRRLADDIGVEGAPSLYRHGPPMMITLTNAAILDDPSDTLHTILDASDNDGIWELRKP